MAEQHDLTPKQRAFVLAYLETGNGVESARRAGYKGNDNTLHVTASENLRKPMIRAALAARRKPVEQARIAEAEEVLGRITEVLRTPGLKPSDTLKAADLLGKRYGLWVTRVEVKDTTYDDSDLEGLSTEDLYQLLGKLRAEKERLARARLRTASEEPH
jgi:phage terminase small subunit